jgi:hypothetical protein
MRQVFISIGRPTNNQKSGVDVKCMCEGENISVHINSCYYYLPHRSKNKLCELWFENTSKKWCPYFFSRSISNSLLTIIHVFSSVSKRCSVRENGVGDNMTQKMCWLSKYRDGRDRNM